jgi:DNA-binding CsgD family transcriptional regulator/PAS domain-containing protein
MLERSGACLHLDINAGLLSVIDELYAGALDHTRLTSSIGRIASLTGGSGGLMYLLHEIEHRVIYGAWSNFEVDAPRQVDGAHAVQVGHYHRQMAVGTPVHIHSLWPIEEMKKTTFYQEVLKKQDVLYGSGSLLLRTPSLHGMFVLNRSERAGPFSDADLDMLRILVPHLKRVMQITLEMNAIAQERETFASTLDSLSIGVVLADSHGKLLHLNRAATQIVARHDGLRVTRGHLTADAQEDRAAFERLIGLASGTGGQSFERGGTCKANRPSGLPPYLLLVTPCSDWQARAFVPLLPACVIFIRDPARRQSDVAPHLRQMFGLTSQESKVAIGIAEGQGLAKVAQDMGLRALTVRNHLQHVFFKTGTSRQAELARLIGTLAN